MEARLLLLGAADAAGLSTQVDELRAEVSRSEGLGGLEGTSVAAKDAGLVRAALVASDADELEARLQVLHGWLEDGLPDGIRVERGLALGSARNGPRIGFLFPGQGAPVPNDAGAVRELLPAAAEVYEHARALQRVEGVPAPLVQLAVVTASVAGLRAMTLLGIDAEFTVGHSIGELTALHWAGALEEAAVLRLARRRGEVMTELATAAGTMANIEADEEDFSRIIDGADVTVACFNSPRNRVVSGATEAVEAVVQRAREHEGARVVQLRVVGAFHSPLMSEAVPVFDRYLAGEEFGAVERPVFSTITGAELEREADLRGLLVRQITEPVQFLDAVQASVDGADLLLEVGPGRMLSGLVAEFTDIPSLPLRVGHSSPEGFLTAVAAAYAVGAPVRADRLRAA